MFDTIFIEQLWPSVKYEGLDVNAYPTLPALEQGLQTHFQIDNYERPHQSQDYRTPVMIHFGAPGVP